MANSFNFGLKTIKAENIKHNTILTIDPLNTFKYDDAFSIVKKDGYYEMCVYITYFNELYSFRRFKSDIFKFSCSKQYNEFLKNNATLKEKQSRNVIAHKFIINNEGFVESYTPTIEKIKVSKNLYTSSIKEYVNDKNNPYSEDLNLMYELIGKTDHKNYEIVNFYLSLLTNTANEICTKNNLPVIYTNIKDSEKTFSTKPSMNYSVYINSPMTRTRDYINIYSFGKHFIKGENKKREEFEKTIEIYLEKRILAQQNSKAVHQQLLNAEKTKEKIRKI